MMILFSSFLMLFSCVNPLSISLSLSLIIFFLMVFSKHDLDNFFVYSSFQLDFLSNPLLLLTGWTILLMILASFQIFHLDKFPVYFSLTVLSLFVVLVLTFFTNDILLFYLYFEMSLIPTLVLILGWGYQPERLQAGVYMLLYTVLASLPLLALLLLWTSWSFSSSIFFLTNLNLPLPFDMLGLLAALMAFSVKLPMYALHLWLPKAHVEAPVAGSMILAGILLKLGGYGVLRLISKIPSLLSSWAWLLIFWSMLGGTLISFLCIFQVDVKSLIALSSVSHMAMVLSAALTLSVWGINGSLIIMLGHGFCSSGLFCIANMAYERTHSRSLFLMKGMMTILPVLTLWWFFLCTSNMAAPPSLNLVGEIHSIGALLLWSKFLLVPISFLVFMAAAYSLYLFTATQHSDPSVLILSSKSITPRELLTLFLHWLPLNLFTLKPNLYLVFF